MPTMIGADLGEFLRRVIMCSVLWLKLNEGPKKIWKSTFSQKWWAVCPALIVSRWFSEATLFLLSANAVQPLRSSWHTPDFRREKETLHDRHKRYELSEECRLWNVLNLERVLRKAGRTNLSTCALSEGVRAQSSFSCAWQASLHYPNIEITVRVLHYPLATRQNFSDLLKISNLPQNSGLHPLALSCLDK